MGKRKGDEGDKKEKENPAMPASREIRKRLATVAAQVGVDAQDPTLVPRVQIDQPIGSVVGPTLGQLLFRCGFFAQGDRVVRVDELTGKVDRMTPDKFGAAIEDFVETTVWKYGNQVPTTMCEAVAKRVLGARQFIDTLWQLKGVHPVRMPVYRRATKTVELLEPGYDEETGIYTCDGVPFKKDLTVEQAKDVFRAYLKDYPFAYMDQGFFKNRSVAVQVALMLGTFCRGFFEPGDLRPMGFYNGNQPGTGKGTLAMMCLTAVFGLPKMGRKPRNDDEFEKRLDTAAMSFDPYLILDDIGGGLFSNALNAFITEPVHSGRIFGTQDGYTAANVTQVFTTGNAVKTTRDIERRSMIVELHLAGEIEGRNFSRLITPKVLATEAVRSEMLAAMWALVRNWGVGGCQLVTNVRPGFEEWTGIMGSIVRAGGFADPLAIPELIMGGDEEGAAWRQFLARLAGEFIDDDDETRNFSTTECLEAAKKWEEEEGSGFSLDDLIGSAKDEKKAFGQRITKWRGRELIDTRGRLVKFGKLRQTAKRVYPCEVISNPKKKTPVPAEEEGGHTEA